MSEAEEDALAGAVDAVDALRDDPSATAEQVAAAEAQARFNAARAAAQHQADIDWEENRFGLYDPEPEREPDDFRTARIVASCDQADAYRTHGNPGRRGCHG
jgi:hypothetical protein